MSVRQITEGPSINHPSYFLQCSLFPGDREMFFTSYRTGSPQLFFLHVLPRGFVRIRHFGFFAHRRRAALLPLCLTLLGQTCEPPTVTDSTPTDLPRPLWLCPQCGGAMAIVERFTASEA